MCIRDRLMPEPKVKLAKLVFLKVSSQISNLAFSPSISTTERQTPLIATDSPIINGSCTKLFALTQIASTYLLAILATSVIMPVNINRPYIMNSYYLLASKLL